MITKDKSPYRLLLPAVALAGLFLAVFFSGGNSLAAPVCSQPDTVGSCCLPFGPAEEPPAAPCQGQDCPCFFCLTLLPARLADFASPPHLGAPPFAPLLPRPLAAFLRHIDYPPERA